MMSLTIKELKVQHLTEPLGITTQQPLLSYLLESREQEQYQSAWRIQAASECGLLETGMADLWDSGKRPGRENFGILYEGRTLTARQRVYWRVQVWDRYDREMPWSRISFWEMGLLQASDWLGDWIGQGDTFCGKKSKAPMLACDFNVSRLAELKSARLYISGLGLYRASVNGNPVADTIFDPGESDAGKTVYYVTYDIGKWLTEGGNALGVILGNGQYTNYLVDPVMALPDGTELPEHRYQKNDSKFVRPGIYGDKKLLAQIELTYADGTCETAAVSDESWQWADSPVVFQNWYGGEDYDATMEQDGWDRPGYPRENWKNVQRMTPPGGVLCGREFPPIRIIARKKAAAVTQLPGGNWLVDMGQNGAGVPELYLERTAAKLSGQWIRMYPAELLKADHSGVDQASCTQSWSEKYHCAIINSYRIKGGETERWHPHFAYQGFRYLEVEGFPGTPSVENFSYCFVRTDNEKNGSFRSSDETMNRINRMVEASMESNMFSAFTDCPQIEKLGWIETSHLMFRSLAGTYEISAWMKKIIHDITDSQVNEKEAQLPGNEREGYVTSIVPEYYRIGGLCRDPNWSGACVFTPWEYYQYYGDITVLKKAFPVMENYQKYLQGYLKAGVLADYAQMGEWGEMGESTPTVLVATCAYYRMLTVMAETAELLGKEERAVMYRKQALQVQSAFHKHPQCYQADTGRYGSGSQASYGCVIFSGLVPQNEKNKAVNRLAEAVKSCDYHLSSGEVGLRQVFTALAENGRSDVVYRMVMNETSPSYRYFADRGHTTLPEYWNCDELWHGMVRSQNHAMMGHVKEWFTYYLLGIRPLQPGFSEVRIRPYLPDGMKAIEGKLVCPYGEIGVSCRKEIDYAELEVKIPIGVKAVVECTGIVGENDSCPERFEAVAEGSGRYRWGFKINK